MRWYTGDTNCSYVDGIIDTAIWDDSRRVRYYHQMLLPMMLRQSMIMEGISHHHRLADGNGDREPAGTGAAVAMTAGPGAGIGAGGVAFQLIATAPPDGFFR